MQRIKRLLAALVILIPLFAAAGFLRMATEVLAIGPRLPTGPDALLHKTVLASWNAYLVKIYLGAIFLAFLLGRFHSLWARLFQTVPRKNYNQDLTKQRGLQSRFVRFVSEADISAKGQ